jgi:hypothetical protein
MLYDTNPAVAGLNKVPGFDPRKFLRKTSAGEQVLDLKYKKLWFRLAHPQGRVKVSALKITEQIAIIEAKIFFSKDDAEPVSSFIAQRGARDGQGQLYIEAAQYAAVDQALEDAGFGLQLCDGKRPPAEPAPHREEKPDAAPVAPVAQSTATPAIQAAAEIISAPSANEDPPVQSAPIVPPIPAAQPEVQADMPETKTEETPLPVPADSLDEPAETPPAEEPLPAQPAYTADMPVEEICGMMTVEDAEAVVVDVGTCKDWTLAQVFEKRPASLKWYMNGYAGDNNILRAGAKLLLEQRAA